MVEAGVGVALDLVALGRLAGLDRRVRTGGQRLVVRCTISALAASSRRASLAAAFLAALPSCGGLLGGAPSWRQPSWRGFVDHFAAAGQRGVGEDHVVAAQHVVGVELAALDQLHLGQVEEALDGVGVVDVDHDQAPCPRRRARRAAATASLVFGASKPHASMTTILPSAARSLSAERRASLIIFFGVFWSYLRGFGPRATPPPLVVRRADGALTGVAGALLLERLLAATADLGAGLGALRADCDERPAGR